MDDDSKIGLKYGALIHRQSIKVISLGGSFTLYSYSQTEPVLLREFSELSVKLVALDMKELKFITSFAISKIIQFYKVAALRHAELVFLSLSPQPRNVFQMTNLLDGHPPIFASLEEVEKYYEEKYGPLPA